MRRSFLRARIAWAFLTETLVYKWAESDDFVRANKLAIVDLTATESTPLYDAIILVNSS